MEYEKPFLTFDEQADLLARRGLVFDRDVLIPHLKLLSAKWLLVSFQTRG